MVVPSSDERSAVKESTARVLGPTDGKAGELGSMGVRFLIDGDESGGGFSLGTASRSIARAFRG
jgi:hypothetical protein